MFYPLLVLVPALVLLVVKTSIELRKIRAIIADCPTLYTLILSSPLSAYLLPNSIPGVTAGCLVPYVWKHRFDALKHLLTGPDFVAIVSMLPNVFTTYVVADPVAIKDITFNRTRFHKQVAVYNILGAFGSNVVASEGELWKHYRKISASAFSERNARLVWEESVRVVDELINHKWEAKDEIQVDDALGLTLELALLVISGASFGQRISWDDEDVETNNHQLTFKHALEVASSDAVLRMVLPDWLLRLGPTRRIRQIKLAFDELEKYMLEMIEVRVHSDDKEDRHDLFSNLINANTDMQLSQEELLSHLLMFQIVGHDTSGSTLCFALALLALHQDIQEILFQETLTMMGGSRAPKNMNEFTYCKAVIYECLRMYPPVCYIPKTALEDTNIPFSKPDGGQMTIPILKGSTVGIDIIGLHHNPRYWEDPATFQPSRFLGDWNKDAFIPYFSGPRSCMGRSFFETEAVAVLTTLIHSFKIEILEEPQFACETFAQRETRILDVVHDAIVLRPTRVPLVFKRRT